VPGLSYAFQPMLSTRTGRLLALEALARPESGTIHDILRDAARAGRLVEVDAELAAGAIRAATTAEVPLHVNVLAMTVTRTDVLQKQLLPAVRATGRRPADITGSTWTRSSRSTTRRASRPATT
jgi:predicted signal transduction protein with EAL and GGDEF domain